MSNAFFILCTFFSEEERDKFCSLFVGLSLLILTQKTRAA